MQYRNFLTTPKETVVSTTKKFSYYKSGIKVKFPKKGPQLRMQILPAYNPNDPTDPQGFVPCLVNGQPTPWFGMIQAAKFVGHGDWKSTLPILSLSSFEGREPCPYERLRRYCKENPDWKYLITKTGRFGADDYQDAVLKPVKSVLLMNIVDVDNPGQGVQLGEFTYSVANDLLNEETGLVFQRNLQLENYPGADQALIANPMLAYANGDITDPSKAPVFIVELPPIKTGQFGAGYIARIEVSRNQVSRRSCSDIELAARYHLDDPESFMAIPSGQDIVDALVTLLKGHKNANGVDETCAIKEAVGDTYRVDTVLAPGSVNTVQGWKLPPEEKPEIDNVHQSSNDTIRTYPAPNPTQTKVPVATPTGFGTNPAIQDYIGSTPEAIPGSTPGISVGAIPGEPQSGNDAALAASLAARMRAQMNLRR